MIIRLFVINLMFFLFACSEEPATREKAGLVTMEYAANAAKWVDNTFQPSTLSLEAQLAEMAWFTQAAAPFRGMEISVVSETLTTHEFESETLARAFFEITGIRVTHDLIQEGDVIEKLLL